MKEILITSSVLIAVLLVLRLVFTKKVHRTLIYGAWALVALRLMIPIQIGEMDFSVLTAAKPLTETVTEIEDLRIIGQNEREAEIQVTKDYIEQDQTVFTPEVQEYIRQEQEANVSVEEIATALVKTQGDAVFIPQVRPQVQQQVAQRTDFISIGQFAKIIWLAGVAVMAVWFVTVNLRHSLFLRKHREKLDCDGPIPVYVSDKVGSPCLVGLLRPVIYLTPESAANEETRRHVLTHELTHYRHGDHIWSLVRCVCLCVYWFHPLVWVAAWFSRRDCELACDEGALKRLGEQERIAYGKSLLEVVSHASAPAHLMQTATSMNETKKQLKERVNFIVKKPKWSIVAAICMVLVCAIVAGCTATGSRNEGTAPSLDPDGRYTVTVTKKAGPDQTMILVYNGKGQLLEYQANSRKTLYTYDEQGNMLSHKTCYLESEELVEETYYSYNDAGQLIRTEGCYWSDWNVYINTMSEFGYDEAGNLICEKEYRRGELHGEYFYDANGNLIEAFGYLGGGFDTHTVYTYTEDGKILTKDMQRGGEPYSGEQHFYDENGRIIRVERYIMSGGIRKELTNTFTYDEHGRCIRYDMGSFQGEHSYEEYTYDAMGNMLSSKYYHYTGEISEYRWTYDEQGRMLSIKSIGERYSWGYVWTYDDQGNVATMVDGNTHYTLHYSWPEEALPQNIQEDVARRIAAFTKLTSLTPEVYARVLDKIE